MKKYLSTPIIIAVLSLSICAFVLIQNARADQGNMHHALDDLRSACAARHDDQGSKVGHRQVSSDLVDRAIEQVNQGISVGEEND